MAQIVTDRPVRLGMLTPSSNTVLEPLAADMVSGLPNVERPLQPLQSHGNRLVGVRAQSVQ